MSTDAVAPTTAAERDAVLDTYRNHLSTGRASLAEMMAAPLEVRSAGCRVYAPDGADYLNCGGYGVFILGHCHPAVVGAVAEQVGRHPLHTSVLIDPLQASAATALAAAAPPGLDSVRFTNSGSEATEVALKIARMHGKNHIVSTVNGFHGKTLGALSATMHATYQDPFQPLLPGASVRFGDADELESAIVGREDCCVIVEPIQGEGGVVIPPAGYLRDVADLCRRHGALLIFDEIQVGLGRTGRLWASEHDGATPDLMLVGKGLSGGVVPVAAVVATAEVYLPFSEDPVLHSSTFAGSPIAMAAARAAIQAIADEGLVTRAAQIGDELLQRLTRTAAESAPDVVREVRGRGLLIGMEFVEPSLVIEAMLELLEHHVIVNHSFNDHAVLRLTPPAILEPADVDRVVEAFAESLAAVQAMATG
jgi:putrescine aminotransferase